MCFLWTHCLRVSSILSCCSLEIKKKLFSAEVGQYSYQKCLLNSNSSDTLWFSGSSSSTGWLTRGQNLCGAALTWIPGKGT